jgi:SAM-dependent methyltransferase
MNSPKWIELSTKQQLEYLMDGKIRLEEWYIDEARTRKQEAYSIDEYRERIRNRGVNYYGDTDKWLYEALVLCPIKGLEIAIMGSTQPWYECVALEFGGKPTTIEYNLPGYNHPEMKEVSVQEYWKTPIQFDVALSISSFEHDGLGRYGDPLNPDGDLRAMAEMKKIVKKDGILFLAVPIGKDKVVWNAHRIYGRVRFPMLIDGWHLEGCVGMDDDLMDRDTGNAGVYQPILVLRNV